MGKVERDLKGGGSRLPPAAPWPTEWRPSLSNGSSAMGALVALVALVLALWVKPPPLVEGLLIVAAVILALFRQAVVSLAQCAPVVLTRVRQYGRLHSSASALETRLRTEAEHFDTLAATLVAGNAAPAFRISDVSIRGGEVVLLLEKKRNYLLEVGETLTVVRVNDMSVMGRFCVVEVRQDAYVAGKVDLREGPAAMWWGYLVDRANADAPANTRAVAVPLARRLEAEVSNEKLG